MKRCSFCEWIPILPWPVWPLAEQCSLGQNVVVGSMLVLQVALGNVPRGVCLDPRLHYKCTSPRLPAELPHLESGHYTDHLQSLQAACEWMDINRGRAARYSQLIREFFEEDRRSREHILAYNESCEISDLYTLWNASVHNFPSLERKIKEVFSDGPVLREDE